MGGDCVHQQAVREGQKTETSQVDLTAETAGNGKAGDRLGHRHHVVQDHEHKKQGKKMDDSPGLQEKSLWPVQGSAWKNSMRQGSGGKKGI